MRKKTTNLAEKRIGNLDFLRGVEGAYCFKKNDKGVITQYAYFFSSVKHLYIIDDLKSSDNKEYVWDFPSDPIIENANKSTICQFWGELLFKELFEKGTPSEQKEANTMWQLYIPQENAPSELVSIVESIKSKKRKR